MIGTLIYCACIWPYGVWMVLYSHVVACMCVCVCACMHVPLCDALLNILAPEFSRGYSSALSRQRRCGGILQVETERGQSIIIDHTTTS